MKKSLLASTSLGAIAFVTGAHGADLGAPLVYKAAPLAPAPAVWSWTGFYVGANVGAAWSRSSVSDGPEAITWIGIDGVGTVNANNTGVIGGFQAGYNWQFSNLVVGIEGDISVSSLNRTVDITPHSTTPDTYSTRLLDPLGTVRGRIGWAFDRVLVYGTGGVAFAGLNDRYSDPPSVIGFTASTSSSVGWTIGGGVEYAFTNHWTARAEYLHVGFPDRTVTVNTIALPYSFVFKDSFDIGRVGINYKF